MYTLLVTNQCHYHYNLKIMVSATFCFSWEEKKNVIKFEMQSNQIKIVSGSLLTEAMFSLGWFRDFAW